MKAPASHMTKATPTLPDECRMLLGVAYILLHRTICSYLLAISWIRYDAPGSYHPIKNKKSGTEEAYRGCGILFSSNTIESSRDLT